jgi:hypothetical protein
MLGVELLTKICTIEGGGVWSSRTPPRVPTICVLGFGPSTWTIWLVPIDSHF